MDKSHLRKIDLITGLILIGGGAFAAFAGWMMPRSPRLDPILGVVTSPGLLPLACGILLAVMGAYLLVHAARNGGLISGSDVARAARRVTGPDVKRMLVVTLLLSVFVFGLIGRMPYWIAAMLYLAALISYLRGASVLVTLIIAAAVAAGVHLIFAEIVRIPLP